MGIRYQLVVQLCKGNPQPEMCWFGTGKIIHLCLNKHFPDQATDGTLMDNCKRWVAFSEASCGWVYLRSLCTRQRNAQPCATLMVKLTITMSTDQSSVWKCLQTSKILMYRPQFLQFWPYIRRPHAPDRCGPPGSHQLLCTRTAYWQTSPACYLSY